MDNNVIAMENGDTGILLIEEIKEEVVRRFIDLKQTPQINVIINSQGGDLYTSAAIYWQLRKFSSNGINIVTTCLGKAESGAAMVFMAGDDWVFEYPSSYVTIHAPIRNIEGNFALNDLEKCTQDSRDSIKIIKDIYADVLKRKWNDGSDSYDRAKQIFNGSLECIEFTNITDLLRSRV